MNSYRLKENHPDFIKIRQLEELANELGIYISVGHNNQIRINMDDGKWYEYRDIEQTQDSNKTTTEFPIPFESKIIDTSEYY